MLVLAFSVQGIADALSFRESRTGDLQTVVVNNEFTISFSVTLGGNTTAIRDANGKLIKDSSTDGGAGDARIDSSGYLVAEVNGREYRTIATDPTGTLAIDPRPTYNDGTPASAGTAVSPYYVDSSGNVVDSGGNAVYVQTGTGDRGGSDPWRYTRAKADPNDKVPDANRYHYNEESISILAPANVNLRRVGSHSVNVAGGTAHTMDEMKNSVNEDKLTSTIRLTYFVTTAGKYTITITDTTPGDDRPGNASPPLSFTIFAVPSYEGTTALSLTGAGADGYETRNDNADPRVDDLFSETGGSADNAPIIYSVEGSGSLYVKETYTDGSPDSQSSATRTLSTSSAAMVYLDMRGGSNKVTAYVRDQNAVETGKTIYFIFNYAQIEIISGDNQTGVPNARLIEPLGIRVKDAKGRALSGLAVTFDPAAADTLKPVIGTDVYLESDNTWADAFADIVRTKPATSEVPPALTEDTARMVPTDRSGEAQVYLELGDAGSRRVTVSVGGATKMFDVTSATTTDIPALEVFSGNNQRSDSNGKVTDPLVVRVLTSNNQPFPQQTVTFTTTKGYLTTLAAYQRAAGDGGTATTNGPTTQVTAVTDLQGKAAVSYDLVNHEGAADVIAEISSTTVPTYQRRITFNINGTGSTSSRDTSDTSNTEDPANTFAPLTLIVGQTSIEGTPGSTQQLTITASETAQVGNIVFGEFLNAGGSASPTSGSGTFTSTLTLPSTEGEYDLVVNMGTERRTVTVTVSRTAASDTQTGGQIALEVPVSGAPNSSQSIRVTVINAAGGRVPDVDVTLSITSGGGTFSASRVTTGAAGTATSQLTLGSTPGNNYVVTATAPNYPSVEKRISITGTQPPTGDTSEQRAAGEAAAIDVYDGDGQRGIPNARLSELLIVEVTDANGTPVSGERVTFRTTIGSGRFSPARPRTNGGGRAQTWFTPTSSGTLRIAASVDGVSARAVFRVTTGAPPASLTKVSGDSQGGTPGDALANPFVVEVKDADGKTIEGVPVAFSVTAGGGRLSETSATTDRNGRAETTLTLGSRVGINSVEARVSGVDPVTFNTSIEPEILVAAANRPVMYWIDGGALYRLAGAKATQITASANGIAVGGGKVYWTATTGASAGTINAANLDGSGAKVLTRIMAVPMGIAVDTADSKLYWTNARGRIQSANLDGSGIRNVQQNLSSPTDLVVANGFIYWTENATAIKRVNLKGQKQVQDVATNLDTVGGLAVGGGKVYWTEQTGASAGTVNGANLNGTQFEALATLLSAPMGISVDTAGSKLYWTNARGRIQSANLDGSGIRNVVKGLIAPSQLRTAGANTDEPVAKQPAKKDTSAYDVNGDGKVDNVDASLVASGLDTGNAKYDVNKDGAVNFLDLLLIFDNRDADAAGAPTVVGMQLTAVQRDRIEAQIDLLIATNDRSAAAMRTLVYLQQLLVTARPEKTQLLANYPNPFNPETWMPYELATDTDVRITIYNAQGVVVRTLQLGQQSAGYYTDREQAAYWDGRNAFGERVASGVYFYQLKTDSMSALRKMVILK